MFTVTGTIDSVGYRVGVHPEPLDHPDASGVVMGSSHAMSWLRLNEGQEFQTTPTSDPEQLALDNPASVLAFLRGTTNVTAVEGDDIPQLNEGEPGSVQ